MPGSVFPREAPRPTKSVAEVALWKALRKNLPDGWHAWHSLRLRVGRGWEGEGDFVVAAPGRGMLVLEVKGGRMELRDGRWFQNGKELARAPRDQGNAFVRRLADAVRKAGAQPPPFGVACVFPDCEFSEGPDTGELAGIVIGGRDLPWLGYRLQEILDKALPERAPHGDAWIPALHALWGETWAPHVRLRDRVRDAEDRAVALNEQQLQILDFAGDNERALVEGGAGTGKTIIARELCLRRARAGGDATYLCFTDALAGLVAHSFEGAPGLKAISLRRLALDVTGAAPPDDAPGWKQLLTRAAGLLRDGPAPSLVVVDEAQDLEPADWTLVEALARRDLWAFRDPLQGFWPERVIDPAPLAHASRLNLLRQERSPAPVAAFAARYRSPGAPLAIAPGDEVMRVVPAPTGGTWEAVRAELDRLVAAGAGPGEIAIVSLAGQIRTELQRLDTIGDHRLVRADAPDAASHVVADTFLRFKGLERPFVLVVEAGLAKDARYDVRMHIALTRATAGCCVVAEPDALEADPRLAALALPDASPAAQPC